MKKFSIITEEVGSGYRTEIFRPHPILSEEEVEKLSPVIEMFSSDEYPDSTATKMNEILAIITNDRIRNWKGSADDFFRIFGIGASAGAVKNCVLELTDKTESEDIYDIGVGEYKITFEWIGDGYADVAQLCDDLNDARAKLRSIDTADGEQVGVVFRIELSTPRMGGNRIAYDLSDQGLGGVAKSFNPEGFFKIHGVESPRHVREIVLKVFNPATHNKRMNNWYISPGNMR
jgi:hypothetical protein